MNILATQYSLRHRSLDIYLAGCRRKCEGCHNPESWNFKSGVPFNREYAASLSSKLDFAGKMIDNLFVMGGEPLDQPLAALLNFLETLNTSGKKIWLFTSWELEEIPYCIFPLVDYVKVGKFDVTQIGDNVQFGIKLATLNQNIYQIKGLSLHAMEQERVGLSYESNGRVTSPY